MKTRVHFLSFALFSAFFFNLVAQTAAQETSTENTSETTTSTPLSEYPETKIAIWFATLTTVFVGGLGDKTFLIAAFMSMKFPPLLILVGASGALTIILGASAAFGAVVPELIPPSLIHVVIIILFFFFGAKFLYEAYTFQDQKMQDDQNEVQHQIEMVESKLMRSSIIKSGKHDHENQVPLINLENKHHNHPLLQIAPSVSEELVLPSPISPKVHQPEPKFELEVLNKRAVLFEIFSMVFLAEWGDRSQIYTIALASQYNGFIVFLGAILGHIASLIVAIIGGRLFAERISERTILFIAGILYILLGIFTIID